MTVEEAREKSVCRLCGVEIQKVKYQPKGWQFDYGERYYPSPALTLNFGNEFAHTQCLTKESKNADSKPSTPE